MYNCKTNSSTPGWSLQRRWLWCGHKCEDYGRHRRGLVSFLLRRKRICSPPRWVLWGVNCGEAPYPGGYDWYPCQHERFIQQVHTIVDIQDFRRFLFLLIKTFAGQRAVDQQCDLLRRKARQVWHEHNCHHRQCVHACSGGELYFKNLWQSSQTLPTNASFLPTFPFSKNCFFYIWCRWCNCICSTIK